MIKTKPSHMQAVLKKIILFLCHETLLLEDMLQHRNQHIGSLLFVLSPGKLSPSCHGYWEIEVNLFCRASSKKQCGLSSCQFNIKSNSQKTITIHSGKLQLNNKQSFSPSGSVFGVRSQADLGRKHVHALYIFILKPCQFSNFQRL